LRFGWEFRNQLYPVRFGGHRSRDESGFSHI
jgi:hypothetical protein